jgi:ElaB/YqjD/DUF883 family membrane-anchored ribosome-binding protein
METYFDNMLAPQGTKERLVHDLRTLVHDAEDLIVATGGNLAGKSREELLSALERVKSVCQRMEQRAAGCAATAERTIRRYPYQSVSVAFSLGVLVGILAARR